MHPSQVQWFARSAPRTQKSSRTHSYGLLQEKDTD